MSEAQDEIRLVLEQEGPYAFHVRIAGTGLELHTDEPPPLGAGAGPNPSALLLAGVANCLAASLLFALRKFKNAPGPIRAEITARRERNAAGRWRIPRAEVTLTLADPAASLEHFERALAQFEQFCIVTQSVREGMAVEVAVVDAAGVRYTPGAPA
ncbi:OsmC family protein [Thermomonas flagellata]|uniref:OsmC family protein n=1 Tax=Thermomonas flagellata TaxID=2888524 RepID=UPI001F0486B6|nr:OsmC family protein [Thermomonas flagellata]